MIYITIIVLLMVLSTISRAFVIYFGLTEIMPMFDYMNSLIMVALSLKATFVLVNFTIGELRNGRISTHT